MNPAILNFLIFILVSHIIFEPLSVEAKVHHGPLTNLVEWMITIEEPLHAIPIVWFKH